MPQEKEVPSLGTEERGTHLLSIYSTLDICYLWVARAHHPKFSTETTIQRGYLSQECIPSKETPQHLNWINCTAQSLTTLS